MGRDWAGGLGGIWVSSIVQRGIVGFRTNCRLQERVDGAEECISWSIYNLDMQVMKVDVLTGEDDN